MLVDHSYGPVDIKKIGCMKSVESFTTECQWELIRGVSNDTISTDLE